jgi:hypothetical protein
MFPFPSEALEENYARETLVTVPKTFHNIILVFYRLMDPLINSFSTKILRIKLFRVVMLITYTNLECVLF